jgi:hypothetical protein
LRWLRWQCVAGRGREQVLGLALPICGFGNPSVAVLPHIGERGFQFRKLRLEQLRDAIWRAVTPQSCAIRLPGVGALFVSTMLVRTRPARPAGFIEPCLPLPAERPPTGPSWIHASHKPRGLPSVLLLHTSFAAASDC